MKGFYQCVTFLSSIFRPAWHICRVVVYKTHSIKALVSPNQAFYWFLQYSANSSWV